MFHKRRASASNRDGVRTISITIVPDSGTDELAGIIGGMTLVIDGKKHSYDLEYTLAPAH